MPIALRVSAIEPTLSINQVTVDLDVLVRDDLLTFLKSDSEKRGATILCKMAPTALDQYQM